MQAIFNISFGYLSLFTSVRAKAILVYICWASSRVGVKTSPRRHCGREGMAKCSFSLSNSERMGAAKANVFPDPVCAATKKS